VFLAAIWGKPGKRRDAGMKKHDASAAEAKAGPSEKRFNVSEMT
jgi:hypothetical protein